eukprot:scaffold12240_cov77-Attheya_sp.AAC.3
MAAWSDDGAIPRTILSSCNPIILVIFAITPPWIGGGLPVLSHALFALDERSIATPPVPLLHVLGVSSPW